MIVTDFMWKLENGKFPDNITSKYQRISHNYYTGQSIQSSIQIPSVRLNYTKRFTIYNGTFHGKMKSLFTSKTRRTILNNYRNYLMRNII